MGNPLDERQIGALERGDLVARHAEVLEELDGRLVEGRAEALHAQLRGALEEGRVPLPGRVGQLVELVKRLPLPQAALITNEEVAVRHVERDGVRGIGLELQGVGPRRSRRVDQGQSALERLVMIAAHLRHDEGALVVADLEATDADAAHGG